MTTKNIQVKILQAGQPRPYADSVYEGEISCRVDGMLLNDSKFYQSLTREHVLEIARMFLSDYSDTPGPFDPRLTKCSPIGPTPAMIAECHEKWKPKQESRWHVCITSPFTD